jgi:hypothetical protein
MSETTENIAKGIQCQICGAWMEDMFIYDKNNQETVNLDQDKWDNPPGYPRTCRDCKPNRVVW